MVKGGQVGLSLRPVYQDLGIPVKIEIQSDSSTVNSLTDRLGAGQRTKHIDTRYFWIQERVQDGDLSIKKVPTAKNCADVGTKPVCASGILLTVDPTLHYKMKACQPMMDPVTGLQTRYGQRPDMNTETQRDHGITSAQKQKVVNIDREHRDGCAKLSETSEWWTSLSTSHDERTMTAIARSKARARCNAMARCSATFCELTDAKFGAGDSF